MRTLKIHTPTGRESFQIITVNIIKESAKAYQIEREITKADGTAKVYSIWVPKSGFDQVKCQTDEMIIKSWFFRSLEGFKSWFFDGWKVTSSYC